MRLFVSERRSHVVIASIIFPLMAAGVIYAGTFVHNASNIRQDVGQIGGLIARGIMAKQIQAPAKYSAEEFPEVNREAKRGRADRAPPYFGNVLSFDRSKVI